MLLAVPALPLAVLYANAYRAHSPAAQLGLGVLLLVAGAASNAIWRKRLWIRPVLARIEAWYPFDPGEGEVAVSITEADRLAAERAIRRAQLRPSYSRPERFYSPPGLHIAVVRPLLAPALDFDGVAQRTREALAHEGIGARVVGVDVLGGPRGRVAEHAA